MDFRRFFGLFRHTTVRPGIERELATQPTPPQATPRTHVRSEEAYPAHTCVDQPILRCPACLKWTGDGFASVKGNPEGFPGIFGQPATKPIQYERSGYAVMVRVKLVDGWAWRTWTAHDTSEQAASHAGEGQKNVPFGSNEWKALLRPTQNAPECSRNAPPQDLAQGETFVDSVLQLLDAYGLDPSAELVGHIDCTSTNPVEQLKSCEAAEYSEPGEQKLSAEPSADSPALGKDSRSETRVSPDPT